MPSKLTHIQISTLQLLFSCCHVLNSSILTSSLPEQTAKSCYCCDTQAPGLHNKIILSYIHTKDHETPSQVLLNNLKMKKTNHISFLLAFLSLHPCKHPLLLFFLTFTNLQILFGLISISGLDPSVVHHSSMLTSNSTFHKIFSPFSK